MSTREHVTVIGLGAMGSAMAEAFLAAGHPTTVWNRTTALRPYVAAMFNDLATDGPMGFLRIVTEQVEASEYPGGQNNLHMQVVGAGHVVQALRDAGVDTTMPAALKELFVRAEAAGHGADGFTSVAEVIKQPES